jgi:hypothetical protein
MDLLRQYEKEHFAVNYIIQTITSPQFNVYDRLRRDPFLRMKTTASIRYIGIGLHLQWRIENVAICRSVRRNQSQQCVHCREQSAGLRCRGVHNADMHVYCIWTQNNGPKEYSLRCLMARPWRKLKIPPGTKRGIGVSL